MNMNDTKRLLRPGQPVLLLDRRRRHHFARLTAGKSTNVRGDVLFHDQIIGRPDGCRIDSKKRNQYRVFSTTLAEYTLHMERHAAIVYPKDTAFLIHYGDVRPGMRVLEAGLGSGSLTANLLTAVGSSGHVTSYELVESTAGRALKNLSTWFDDLDNHTVHFKNVYEGIEETHLDRIVLDVPEPWQILEHAAAALVNGGIFAAYLPTILQVQTLMLALKENLHFYTSEALEVLERKWHVTEESVRPEHQMVGHTGFLVFSRRRARWDDDPQNPNTNTANHAAVEVK